MLPRRDLSRFGRLRVVCPRKFKPHVSALALCGWPACLAVTSRWISPPSSSSPARALVAFLLAGLTSGCILCVVHQDLASATGSPVLTGLWELAPPARSPLIAVSVALLAPPCVAESSVTDDGDVLELARSSAASSSSFTPASLCLSVTHAMDGSSSAGGAGAGTAGATVSAGAATCPLVVVISAVCSAQGVRETHRYCTHPPSPPPFS